MSDQKCTLSNMSSNKGRRE